MKRPRFKYYLSGYDDLKPEPMYSLWVESSKGYSDVGGQTLIDNGFPIPFTPTFETWRDLVRSKHKCGRCFETVRNNDDMIHHNQTHHLGAPQYVPA